MRRISFEWDDRKGLLNLRKHGIDFVAAQVAFFDPKRVITEDTRHSSKEKRYFCMGRVGSGILTVRFTYRGDRIRIIGAGYWRKGKDIYEEENLIH